MKKFAWALLLAFPLSGGATSEKKQRQVCFQTQDGGYITGQHKLWRILPGGDPTKPVQVSGYGALPIDDVRLPEYHDTAGRPRRIRCMSFSTLFEAPTGYVMFEDGALFYRNDSAATGWMRSFYRVTGAAFGTRYPPESIRCDAQHPEKVWLSLGCTDSTDPVGCRLLYSADAGNHWQDISEGLPRKNPVLDIRIAETQDSVWVTTTTGLYRMHKEAFGGLPEGVSAAWTHVKKPVKARSR